MPVEEAIVGIADFGQLHGAGVSDEDIKAPRNRCRLIEHSAHRGGITYIGLDAEGVAPTLLDVADHRFSFGGIARIIYDYGKTVLGQTPRHRRSNATRTARHNRRSRTFTRHVPPSSGSRRFLVTRRKENQIRNFLRVRHK